MCRSVVLACVFSIQMSLCFSSVLKTENKNTRVCVIGAGIGGLTSAKYLKEEGINFTVLEATRYIGGTWRYDPRVGADENGLPLHTSMYKNLRTNLPKPTMELGGFPMPDETPSFPSWELYYNYLKSYTRHFELEKHIQFLHNVISVRTIGNVWKVKHIHLPSGEIFEQDYDFVIVATGQSSKPRMPNIPGEQLFRGKIIHSHDYRETHPYTNRRVLTIGGGPSGFDLGLDLAEVSKTLFHSHHLKAVFRTPFPSNYVKKPDVKEFNETGAIFVDGTFEELDDVIYCTGFEYTYPFLDESSGLTITPKSVVPLYKYMVNIQHPTMVIMGLTKRACLVVALDAQARYAMALAKGNFTLPSKEEMMKEWQQRLDAIKARGRPMSDIHLLGQDEDKYYAALTAESGIERVPPVMFKIRYLDMQAKFENLYTYRNYRYHVIDDDSFKRLLETDRSNDINLP